MIGADIRDAVVRDRRTLRAAAGAGEPSADVLRFLGRHAGPRVLDLACGDGSLCRALARTGRTVEGVDARPEAVELARRQGTPATLVRTTLPFEDRSFDTVVAADVLERREDPRSLLAEAARVAGRTVLLTASDSTDAAVLRAEGIVPEHFADLERCNFFTVDSLTTLLEPFFRTVSVRRGDPLNPLALVRSRVLRRTGALLLRAGVLRPAYCARLYAVAEV